MLAAIRASDVNTVYEMSSHSITVSATNLPVLEHDVVIQEFVNEPIDGCQVNGYRVEIPDVDPRDYKEDKYAAYFLEPNIVVLQVPAVRCSFLQDAKSFKKAQKKLGVFSERDDHGRDVLINSLNANKERQLQWIVIEFPSGSDLCNRHYPNDHDPLMLRRIVVPHTSTKVTVKGESFKMAKYGVIWKITVYDETPRRIVPQDVTNQGQDELELAMEGVAGMSVDSDSD